MEDKIIIYVAGNPDAFPLEYYDKEIGAFDGVIPHLLEDFSEKSGYQLTYYQPGEEDHRESFAENNQVDILSGYVNGEAVPENTEKTQILQISANGENITYYLCFTEAAPDSLKADLKDFLASVQQQEISGILVETAVLHQSAKGNHLTVFALGFIIIILVCAMILIVRRYKNKLFRFREYLETDEATGLGNQDYFIRKFDQLTNNKTKTLYQIVYFYVDYDHLYRICNREQADEFMRYCAEKIKERTQGNEVLARVADNGFSVLKFAGTAQDLHQWIITLFREIHAYSVKQGRPYDMSISVGVYPIKENDRNLREMLYNALECAQIARRGENLYLTCTDSLMRTVMEERYLQESMDKAFVNKEFQLYLQFYVEAGSFRVVGGEALSRWNHPQKGIIMPSVFVPLMEKEKMISRLDYYCLERVCEFLEHLWKKQIDSFFISCNFSRDTFSSADFVDQCKRIMAPFDFPKELLIFEITESAAAKSVAQVQENILALRSYGVRIALDDFGEGFSSFYDIQQYPIDGVKLDKGLVDDILSPSGSAIVRAMIQVGHELGMTILAEGVETEEQVYALQKMNCDVIQGFHFYVPLPYWDAEKRLLEEYQKRT